MHQPKRRRLVEHSDRQGARSPRASGPPSSGKNGRPWGHSRAGLTVHASTAETIDAPKPSRLDPPAGRSKVDVRSRAMIPPDPHPSSHEQERDDEQSGRVKEGDAHHGPYGGCVAEGDVDEPLRAIEGQGLRQRIGGAETELDAYDADQDQCGLELPRDEGAHRKAEGEGDHGHHGDAEAEDPGPWWPRDGGHQGGRSSDDGGAQHGEDRRPGDGEGHGDRARDDGVRLVPGHGPVERQGKRDEQQERKAPATQVPPLHLRDGERSPERGHEDSSGRARAVSWSRVSSTTRSTLSSSASMWVTMRTALPSWRHRST